MDTLVTAVDQAFPPRKQYAIPSYQRNYVWTRQGQWEPLWEDVKALTAQILVAGAEAKPHFLGTIITKEIGTEGFISRWWVVDGQQRLTTLQILIAAARGAFSERGLDQYADILSDPLANATKVVMSPSDKYKIKHKSSDYAGICVYSRRGAINHSRRRWRIPFGPLLHLLPPESDQMAGVMQRRSAQCLCKSLHHPPASTSCRSLISG